MSRLVALALSGLLLLAPPALAGKAAPRKKTVTYTVALKLDGRTVVGPFASTESVTGS